MKVDAATQKWLRKEVEAQRRAADRNARDALREARVYIRRGDYESALAWVKEAMVAVAGAQSLADLPDFLEERAES